MSVNKAYTTEAKINSFLNTTIVVGSADDFINAAVATIDKITGRNFIAETVARAKVFNGDGGTKLIPDESTVVSKVERGLDAFGDSFETISEGGSNGYFTSPGNITDDAGAIISPIKAIILRSRNWIKGCQNARITAKWGFSTAVPDDISFVATILAAGMYNFNRQESAGDIKSEKIGSYSITYLGESSNGGWGAYKQALEILQRYIKVAM